MERRNAARMYRTASRRIIWKIVPFQSGRKIWIFLVVSIQQRERRDTKKRQRDLSRKISNGFVFQMLSRYYHTESFRVWKFENFFKMEKNIENIIIVVTMISKSIKNVLQKLNIRKLKKISLENSKIPKFPNSKFRTFEKIHVYLKWNWIQSFQFQKFLLTSLITSHLPKATFNHIHLRP